MIFTDYRLQKQRNEIDTRIQKLQQKLRLKQYNQHQTANNSIKQKKFDISKDRLSFTFLPSSFNQTRRNSESIIQSNQNMKYFYDLITDTLINQSSIEKQLWQIKRQIQHNQNNKLIDYQLTPIKNIERIEEKENFSPIRQRYSTKKESYNNSQSRKIEKELTPLKNTNILKDQIRQNSSNKKKLDFLKYYENFEEQEQKIKQKNVKLKTTISEKPKSKKSVVDSKSSKLNPKIPQESKFNSKKKVEKQQKNILKTKIEKQSSNNSEIDTSLYTEVNVKVVKTRKSQPLNYHHEIITISEQIHRLIAQKIKNKLSESQNPQKFTKKDPIHKSMKHQYEQLSNTFDLQKKLRNELLKKIFDMQDCKKYQ